MKSIDEMADAMRKKAARVKRYVFGGRCYRKNAFPAENWEREQLFLAWAAAAESVARCADQLKMLEEEMGARE